MEAIDAFALENGFKLRVAAISAREVWAVFVAKRPDERVAALAAGFAVLIAHAPVETFGKVLGHVVDPSIAFRGTAPEIQLA
jgi:hypothetical protein